MALAKWSNFYRIIYLHAYSFALFLPFSLAFIFSSITYQVSSTVNECNKWSICWLALCTERIFIVCWVGKGEKWHFYIKICFLCWAPWYGNWQVICNIFYLFRWLSVKRWTLHSMKKCLLILLFFWWVKRYTWNSLTFSPWFVCFSKAFSFVAGGRVSRCIQGVWS